MKLFKDLKILFSANSTYIFSFFKLGKKFIFFQLLFLLATIPINYVIVYAPKAFIDGLFDQSGLVYGLVWIALMIFCKLINHISNQALTISRNHLYALAKIDSKRKAYQKLKGLYFSYFDNPERLNKFNRAFSYNENGGPIFLESIIALLVGITSLFTMTVISASFEWWLWIVILLLVIQQYLFDRKVKQLNFDFMKEKTIYDRQQNYFASIPTQTPFLSELLLNQGFEFILRKYTEIFKKNLDLKKKHAIRVGTRNFLAMLPNELFTLFCYGLIGVKLLNGASTIGDYTLFFSVIANISSNLKTLLFSFNTFYQQSLEAQEYLDFMSQTECLRLTPKNKLPLTQIETIEFQNVSFSYEGLNTPILKQFNLKIKNGERIAIVGDNGAGKTTFVKLLLSFYTPLDGVIKINGTPLEHYDMDSYWSKISTVLQNHQEFSISIAENILFHELQEGDCDRINSVLNAVGLSEKIHSFKDSIDSQLTRSFSADGVELSGGERQRLAIARALIKNSELYVFDEPSSALDANAEDELLNSMLSLPREKTIIYISHRLSNVHFCDRILYFHNGNILADGSHEQLMQTCSEYKEAYLKQSQRYLH